MSERLALGCETTAKRSFVWAVDWPGWARGGKTIELARATFLEVAPRYAQVTRRAGVTLPDPVGLELVIVDEVAGGAGTEFGVPSAITPLDRRPTTAAEAGRLADLVAAAWATFDAVAAVSPAELRKGPRGGGRDRDKMIGHVIEADHAYAREIGVRMPSGSLDDRAAVEAERAAILEVLRAASDGAPLADRRWTQRYAARRVAWHALDHAWEMEDRRV